MASVSQSGQERSRDEALRHVADLAATPAWGADGRILTDLTGLVSSALPDRDQVAGLAEVFAEQLDGRTRPARWAVIANVAFDRAAQFAEAIEADVRSLTVFFDLASACMWLGVDFYEVRPVIQSLRLEARSQDSPSPP